jgi:glycerol-3-phosphate cytidylyltransferase-like family protein
VDTRSKILTPAQAVALAGNLRASSRALTVVTGFFDPLLVEHAVRLASLARPGAALMVVIHSPAEPLLPARGRAEMAAALSVVDHVVLPAADETGAWLEDLHPQPLVSQEPDDARRTRDLIRHVHARQ